MIWYLDLLLFAREDSNNVFGAQTYLDRCRQHEPPLGQVLGGSDTRQVACWLHELAESDA
jgi:hypothetical protein